MISLDTETTGIDFHHAARPFFVTSTNEEGETKFWEWDVDPLTRKPNIPVEDIAEIRRLTGADREPMAIHSGGKAIELGPSMVLQNAKFDVSLLKTIGIKRWNWPRTHDTLIAGHLLATNQRHDLTSMVLHYLGIDIQPHEKELEAAVKECRRLVQQAKLRVGRAAKKKEKTGQQTFVDESELFADWMIAKEGLEGMPSAGDEPWRYDYWLPRAIAKALGLKTDHPFWTVLADYSNADSASTLLLWKAMEKELKRRSLWKIYCERIKMIGVAYKIEQRGVTIHNGRLNELYDEYDGKVKGYADRMLAIAKNYAFDLVLPKGASPNDSLRNFVFGPLGVAKVHSKKAKTDKGSLDKEAMPIYLAAAPDGGDQLEFLQTKVLKSKLDTNLAYMSGYRDYWIPLGIYNEMGEQCWCLLHPSLNPTGTVHLRWSSSHPNEQNISKQPPYKGGKTLRYCFGPQPGREWWSCDAKNIELRIPAYEAGEEEMLQLFERENDPPYFGSNHSLVAHILHKELFEDCLSCRKCTLEIATKERKADVKYCKCIGKDGILDGRIFKKRYADTWYQWCKNGNFAVQYGAIETSGTADRAYHVPGGQARIQNRFGKIKQLNHSLIAYAERMGYVETMPDKTVDPERGYPILCTRTEYGKILPTTPLNYHTSGTACWWAMKAMNRMDPILEEWNKKREPGQGYYMVMYVHDEFVFDFPKRAHPKADPKNSNLGRIHFLQGIMEQGGDDIGIPTPTSCEYHEHNWETGVSC